MTDPPRPDPGLVGEIQDRLGEVTVRIDKAGGRDVTVIGVTKRHSIEVVRAAVAAGLTDLGENYVDEMLRKAAATGDVDVVWHFIGRLQSNKVRRLAALAPIVHSVDRPSIVSSLARLVPGVRVLVQVDLAGTPGRGGCSWDEAPKLVEEAAGAGLDVIGLMGVAPPRDGPGGTAAVRAGFERLARLQGLLGLAQLSIGMTDDLEIAVGEGATMVRVGSALFGSRS